MHQIALKSSSLSWQLLFPNGTYFQTSTLSLKMDRKISGRISNAFRLASVAVLAEVRTIQFIYTVHTKFYLNTG